MTLHWKLVIDTSDAPALADFWAAALGYEVEDQSTLIDDLLATGHIDESVVAEHRGRHIFRGYAAIRHPDDPFDQNTGIGQGRRLLFQDVPEGKPGEPRTDRYGIWRNIGPSAEVAYRRVAPAR